MIEIDKDEIQQLVEYHNVYIQDKGCIVCLNVYTHAYGRVELTSRVILTEQLVLDHDGETVFCHDCKCGDYSSRNPLDLFNRIEIFKLEEVNIETDEKWLEITQKYHSSKDNEAIEEIKLKVLTNLKEIQPYARTSHIMPYIHAILHAITDAETKYPNHASLSVLQAIRKALGDKWDKTTIKQFRAMHKMLADSMVLYA